MFKKILVPLDGTAEAERIGGWCWGLARALGAEVVLFTVIDPDDIRHPHTEEGHVDVGSTAPGEGRYDEPSIEQTRGAAPGITSTPVTHVTPGAGGGGHGAHTTQLVDDAVERARRYLLQQAERGELAGAGTQVDVSIGKPAEQIVAAAERLGADAIAMATRRESALARGILGSVTDRVVHTTPVPLLAIHPESHDAYAGNGGAPSTILVPLDGSELGERAISVAQEIAREVGAKLLCIRAITAPYYGGVDAGVGFVPGDFGMAEVRQDALGYLEEIGSRAKDAGLTIDTHVTTGSAAAAIIDAAEEADDALIVMSTHGRSGFKRFFLGSVADKVIRSAGKPVLILPPNEN